VVKLSAREHGVAGLHVGRGEDDGPRVVADHRGLKAGRVTVSACDVELG
jgi:hypothetical protein